MQFNDTTNKQGIIQHIDFLLFGNGSVFHKAYSLEDRTRNSNLAFDEAVTRLMKADPNWQWDDSNNTTLPIAETDLNPNQDNYGFASELMVIRRVRVKDKQGNFRTLDPVQRTELNDSQLKATGVPRHYYKIGRSVLPVPIPDYGADKGLEVQFQRGANYFNSNDTTKTPGFDQTFHEYIPVVASLKYAISKNMNTKITTLTNEKQRIEQAMMEHYERRAPDQRPRMRPAGTNIRQFGL